VLDVDSSKINHYEKVFQTNFSAESKGGKEVLLWGDSDGRVGAKNHLLTRTIEQTRRKVTISNSSPTSLRFP